MAESNVGLEQLSIARHLRVWTQTIEIPEHKPVRREGRTGKKTDDDLVGSYGDGK